MIVQPRPTPAQRLDAPHDRRAKMRIGPADQVQLECLALSPERLADVEEEGLVFAGFDDAN